MTTLRIEIGCSCLWCDVLIPNKAACEGKMICSKKCLKEMKKWWPDINYDIYDVWRK